MNYNVDKSPLFTSKAEPGLKHKAFIMKLLEWIKLKNP